MSDTQKWICGRCSIPCKADFCTETTRKPKICPFFSLYDAQWQPDVPAAQPEPEMMTMAQAIAKAVEMGGGEVWKDGESECELTVMRDLNIDFYQEQYHTSDGKRYTVRPLAPVTFGWDEALERLQRGEDVQYEIQDGACVVVHPVICATSKNGCMHGSTTVSFGLIKDKQFRALDRREGSGT
jgi:hypothetical protein